MVEMELDSLELKRIPVKAPGRTFFLQEISEVDYAVYQSKLMSLASLEKGTNQVSIGSMDGFADLDALLVSLCLFENDAKVSLDEVKTWPHRIVSKLVEGAKEISGMNDKADKLKNESSATGESSK